MEVRDEIMKELNEKLYEAKLVYYNADVLMIKSACSAPTLRGSGNGVLR